MLSCMIDAEEGREVATIDIPGAFMQADMDEIVHMRLEGTMEDPECEKYVVKEGDKIILYVLLAKALYGTLRVALLFWRRLTDQLKSWGFILNQYDQCVANKIIKGNNVRYCGMLMI